MKLTADQIKARTLGEEDLRGYARRVANYAQQSAEIIHKAALYTAGVYRDPIINETFAMLQTVRNHERSMAREAISADEIAMVLSEEAMIENGKLRNAGFIAVKLAEMIEAKIAKPEVSKPDEDHACPVVGI